LSGINCNRIDHDPGCPPGDFFWVQCGLDYQHDCSFYQGNVTHFQGGGETLSPHKEDVMKYDKDEEFQDPVVRCDSCAKIILTEDLHKNGICKCGNRKVRVLMGFSLFEYLKMRFWWKIDPGYLKIFGRSE